MRRPHKPFVTEYRGSSRRQPTPLNEPAGAVFERNTARPSPPGSRFDSDDSFEAAMRAADALFSTSPRKASQPEEAGAEPEPQAPPVAPATEAPQGKPAGRILRVIDEAPLPQFAALEEQHAPKRRGRKPGSKNKPKPLVSQPNALVADAAHAAASMAAARVQPAPAIAGQATLANAMPRPKKAPLQSGYKKFTWVRDRLKPGEDWKRRRLPRICW